MTIKQSQSMAPMIAAIDNETIDTEALIQAVDEVMLNATQSEVALLEDASRHIISAGGKRVRPQMLLLTYLALGGDDLDYALPVAASIEMVHTASVVHDDINDHGVTRRGKASINAKYGRTFALLTGDFLFTKVYELMAEYGDANTIFASATKALVEGETLQAAAVKENNFSREVYMRVIALKTAELFRAATQIGALLTGADQRTQNAMGDYGYKVGMAFQIVDDILDLTASAEQLGKTAGIDTEQGKGFASMSDNADPMDAIREKTFSGDTINQALTLAQNFIDDAINDLSVLPDGEAKDKLVELANIIIERSY